MRLVCQDAYPKQNAIELMVSDSSPIRGLRLHDGSDRTSPTGSKILAEGNALGIGVLNANLSPEWAKQIPNNRLVIRRGNPRFFVGVAFNISRPFRAGEFWYRT